MESLNLQNLEERLAIDGDQKVYISLKIDNPRKGFPLFNQYEVIKIRQTFPPDEKQIFAVIYEINPKDGSRGILGRLYFDQKGKPSHLSRALLAYSHHINLYKKHKWYLSRL